MALNINGTTGISGVDGSVSAPAVTGTDSNTGITFPSADTIKFSTGGVERLAISNSGISGDGSGLTGIAAGLTMVDAWNVSSDQAYGNGSDVDSHWSRTTGTHGGNVGSAMTQSSGVFTFPSTGLYLLLMQFGFYSSSTQNYAGIRLYLSTDGGSNYSQTASFYTSSASGQYSRAVGQELLDVTDISNFKIKFNLEAQNTLTIQNGQGRTTVFFIRYGDT